MDVLAVPMWGDWSGRMQDGEFCLLDLGNQMAVCLEALWIRQERVATRVPGVFCANFGLRIWKLDLEAVRNKF